MKKYFSAKTTMGPLDSAKHDQQAPRQTQEPARSEVPFAATPPVESGSGTGSRTGARVGDADLRFVELRAVFGVEGPFSPQRVAGLVAELPGVAGCMVSCPAGTAGSGASGGGAGVGEGAETVRYLREIARMTGVDDATQFSLQTGQGTLSFFLEGSSSLTVREDGTGFPPGTRDKLILVARTLDRLA